MLIGLGLGAIWMTISSALILLNKHLLSTDGFHYPMALSGLGMAFSAAASYICCRVGLCCAPCVFDHREGCRRITSGQ